MNTDISPENAEPERPVALIAGPTASGKSALAVALAQRIEGGGGRAVIINADSAQVYSDLAVLSARPDEEEMGGIEHRLFGEWDGGDPCSAADWAEAARREIAQCHESGAVPILVGGTGLYLRILLEGIAPIPPIDPEVRSFTRALPTERAYAALQVEDPARALELEPGDGQRIARALEVKRSTGVSLSDWQMAKTGGIGEDIALFPLLLLPPRQWLYDRCDARFARMVEEGAIAEVEQLLERRLPEELPIMRAIGVRPIAALVSGKISKEEAIAAGQQATRNYAKRQFTWFRRQADAEWPQITEPPTTDNVSIDEYFGALLPK